MLASVPAFTVAEGMSVSIIASEAEAEHGNTAFPVIVKVTEPLIKSEGLGVYVGESVPFPEKLPEPDVVQKTEDVPDAVAPDTVKVFPWQSDASDPADTVGVGVIFTTFIETAWPLQGAEPVAVSVKFTEPAITSAALGR